MKTLNLIILFVATLFITGCQNTNNTDDDTEGTMDTEIHMNDNAMDNNAMDNSETETVIIQLEAKSGSDLSGTATFTQENDEVTLKATINGLSEGEHAIHIHETGDCSSDDGKSAGGHWNPTNQPHGQWGDSEGYHKGDIGNFDVDANGVGTVEFSTDEWCIGCNNPQKDILGKAIIVHDGTDDFTSQPSGAAGTRVGCGVIKR